MELNWSDEMDYKCSKMIHTIGRKKVQAPDELTITDKWDILMLLVPELTKEKVKNQKKNYAKLGTNSMLYLCIDTIVRMFIDIVYLESRPEMPNDRIGLRSFKHLIRNKISEIEELEDELEKVKEGKGMIKLEEHNSIVKELNKKINDKDNEIQRVENKLISERKFAKDKEEYNESRLRKQIEYEMKVKKASTD